VLLTALQSPFPGWRADNIRSALDMANHEAVRRLAERLAGLKKLGPCLKPDGMYGFVPALALGGPATLGHLQKVKTLEQLVRLAQLLELRVMKTP
jgi:hypothetical protein